MREQRRNAAGAQDMRGDPAEDQFAQTAMRVRAHHEEIGPARRHGALKRGGDAVGAARDAARGRGDPMPGQIIDEIGGIGRPVGLLDRRDVDRAGASQEWQRGADRASGLLATVPGNEDPTRKRERRGAPLFS